MDIPTNRALTEEELASTVARAIVDPQFNPGMGHAFAANAHYYLDALLGQQEAGLLRGSIFAANGNDAELTFRISELCWRLVFHGLLLPEGGRSVGEFRPTARGLEYLQGAEEDALLSLTTGWLVSTLQERCPEIGEIALAYAGLSHESFLTAHYEASVVLLGAASESMLHRLADAMNAKRTHLGTPEISDRNAYRRLVDLGAVLRDHRGAVKAATGEHAGWVDDLPALLEGANAIRVTRNDAGHPRRLIARHQEARGLLTLFPQLAEGLTVTAATIELLP